jgi:hypothetical protein
MKNRCKGLWPEGSGDGPTWARCFDRRQEQLFERLVREYFRDQPDAVLQDGRAKADGQQYGLGNVAQLCLELPETEWPRCIARHFDGVRSSQPEALQWLLRKSDPGWARPRLLVRLYRKGALPPAMTVVREDLPGIDTVLVADLPSIACNVMPDDLATWALPKDETFAAALGNLARAQHGTWHTCAIDVAGRVRVHALEGGSLYAASHVLQLERWPERLGRHGALVAVPNRHIVTVYPIDSVAVVAAIQHVLPMVHHMHTTGPGSISRELYWRRPDGTFLHLPACVTGNVIHFLPPDEYSQMVNGLH